MEKAIGKISKNDFTDIVVRMDDFGGNRGLTIREFVTGERYTGFTKSGVRILARDFEKFREMIDSIDENEMSAAVESGPKEKSSETKKEKPKKADEELPDY